MRLSITEELQGMHPSERLVTVKTESGTVQLFVDSLTIKDNRIPVSHPLEGHNGHRLVELPRETTSGVWRVWVDLSDLV
jgi:hypothetical protein